MAAAANAAASPRTAQQSAVSAGTASVGCAARHGDNSTALIDTPCLQPGKEVIPLTVSIPLVLVLGVAVWAAWRYMGLRTWQAILCMLLGFLLAATTAAPQIRHIV